MRFLYIYDFYMWIYTYFRFLCACVYTYIYWIFIYICICEYWIYIYKYIFIVVEVFFFWGDWCDGFVVFCVGRRSDRMISVVLGGFKVEFLGVSNIYCFGFIGEWGDFVNEVNFFCNCSFL